MENNESPKTENVLIKWIRKSFIGMGVLPFLIVIATIIFAILSENFLTTRNLVNVARQSTIWLLLQWGRCSLC
jgi:ribose transport system permease protein